MNDLDLSLQVVQGHVMLKLSSLLIFVPRRHFLRQLQGLILCSSLIAMLPKQTYNSSIVFFSGWWLYELSECRHAVE